MNIIELPLTEIKPNPDNPRYISKDKFEKLKTSIKEFPEMLKIRPIVTRNGIALGGNMRLKALQDLGYKKAWVIKAEDLTEKQVREFIIKDNVGFGEWEWDQLANEWDAEELEQWGLDTPDKWGVEEPEVTDDDFDEALPEEPITILGDLIEIGEHRLLCGDSTDSDQVAKLMNGEKADMVFTDPPWNVNYGAIKEGNPMGYKPRTILNDHMDTESFKDFMLESFNNMSLFSKKGCPTYVVMSAQEWGNMMLALYESGYHWSSTIIWNKSHMVMSRKDYHTKYEPIWYGWLTGAPRLKPLKDRKQNDVWDIDRPTKSELHPTTKPIELLSRALKNSSNNQDLIMELFTGSGSTMVAAHQLNRKCYGMELDPKYCDVIIKRMIKLDPSLKIIRNGQPTEDYNTL